MTTITLKDDRGVWLRLPRHGWESMIAMLLDEAAKWEADGWAMGANPGKPAELRAYADRLASSLTSTTTP